VRLPFLGSIIDEGRWFDSFSRSNYQSMANSCGTDLFENAFILWMVFVQSVIVCVNIGLISFASAHTWIAVGTA
jgi:hypothetical protein